MPNIKGIHSLDLQITNYDIMQFCINEESIITINSDVINFNMNVYLDNIPFESV